MAASTKFSTMSRHDLAPQGGEAGRDLARLTSAAECECLTVEALDLASRELLLQHDSFCLVGTLR